MKFERSDLYGIRYTNKALNRAFIADSVDICLGNRFNPGSLGDLAAHQNSRGAAVEKQVRVHIIQLHFQTSSPEVIGTGHQALHRNSCPRYVADHLAALARSTGI